MKSTFFEQEHATGELTQLRRQHLSWVRAAGFTDHQFKQADFHLRLLIDFLNRKRISLIAGVTAETLQEFTAWDKRRPNIMIPDQQVGSKRHLAAQVVIRNFFQWALAQAIIDVDPTGGLELYRSPGRPGPIIVPVSDVQRLLHAPDLGTPVGYRDRAILEVLYGTGILGHELAALKVDDVDLKEKLLHVRPSKGKARLLPLPDVAAGYLREYVEKVRPMFANAMNKDTGILFLMQMGASLNHHDLAVVFKRSLNRAGMKDPITATTLRNSLAAHLLNGGMKVGAVRKLLGRHQ